MALVSANTARLKRLYRYMFEIKEKGKTVYQHFLMVNPEELRIEEPSRSTVTQTLGGANITDFGQGLPTVNIGGTTGYKVSRSADGQQRDGYEEFKAFRDKVYRHFIRTNDPNMSMHWNNWEDEEYYEIHPHNFALARNKSEPLLYRYELRFTCIRQSDTPTARREDYIREPLPGAFTFQFHQSMESIARFIYQTQGR